MSSGAAAGNPVGHWDVSLRTPIGSVAVHLVLTGTPEDLSGSASARGETVELRELRAVPFDAGHRVTWAQSITRPLRLDLAFDVVVEGDEMSGHSRAGRLPRSTVTGHRVDDEPTA